MPLFISEDDLNTLIEVAIDDKLSRLGLNHPTKAVPEGFWWSRLYSSFGLPDWTTIVREIGNTALGALKRLDIADKRHDRLLDYLGLEEKEIPAGVKLVKKKK